MTIPSTFERDLERGSGRAVLAVIDGDPVEFREAIKRAITANRPFDGQTEDNRSAYLWFLVEATKEPGYYAATVCDLLRSPLSDDTPYTYSALAYSMATAGFSECLDALRDGFARWALDGSYAGAIEIVKLGEKDGLIFVAKH